MLVRIFQSKRRGTPLHPNPLHIQHPFDEQCHQSQAGEPLPEFSSGFHRGLLGFHGIVADANVIPGRDVAFFLVEEVDAEAEGLSFAPVSFVKADDVGVAEDEVLALASGDLGSIRCSMFDSFHGNIADGATGAEEFVDPGTDGAFDFLVAAQLQDDVIEEEGQRACGLSGPVGIPDVACLPQHEREHEHQVAVPFAAEVPEERFALRFDEG